MADRIGENKSRQKLYEAIYKDQTTYATANTLGTVEGKMEVFDRDGTSLGFVPLYDAITTV